MFVLDTNIISALRRADRNPKAVAWLTAQREDDLYLSVITLGEIERGIIRQESANPPFADDLREWLNRTVISFSDRLLPFAQAEARIWGQLSAKLGHDGADLLIAATALAHDATVVTRNIVDFQATGCKLINPFSE